MTVKKSSLHVHDKIMQWVLVINFCLAKIVNSLQKLEKYLTISIISIIIYGGFAYEKTQCKNPGIQSLVLGLFGFWKKTANEMSWDVTETLKKTVS